MTNAYKDGILKFSKTFKPKRRKNPIKPWISPAILCSINKKTKLYQKYQHKRSLVNENKYKKYRNVLTNVLRDAKRLYFERKFAESKNDGKKTWALLNEILNRKTDHDDKIPDTLKGDEEEVYGGNDIPNVFNDYFSSIGVQLDSKMPTTDSNPLKYVQKSAATLGEETLMVSPNELAKIIKSLNLVGGGIDQISTKILLGTYEKCIHHLVHFINLCLTTSVFPDLLKVAIIKPIFKSKERSKLTNYRPISLLPVFSKLLEKVLHSHLMSHLVENNLIHPLQFGFRKYHSTYMPLCKLTDEITKSMQDDQITCCVYLDLKKAFDTVSIEILLEKLYAYGLRKNLYSIMQSYLSNRTQRTKIKGQLSKSCDVQVGVPQGSILGPLLFIMYINDLPNIDKDVDFYLFADDTAIVAKAKTRDELQSKLNNLLPLVSDWLLTNRLSLNTEKTNYQLFSKGNMNEVNIKLNGKKINRKSCIKYLGVYVEENLKWNAHIDSVSTTISRNIGMMARVKFFLSSHELLLLYNSLVLPYLNYCAVVWGSNYATRLNKLTKLQKRALRIIDKKPFLYPSNELFIKYKLLKFPEIVKQQTIMILLAFINDNLPYPITAMFKPHRPVSARLAKHFEFPYAATNYRSFSLSIAAPLIWNSVVCKLFKHLADVPRSKEILKKHIKTFFIDKYLEL